MGGSGAKSWTIQLGFRVMSPAHRGPRGYPAPTSAAPFCSIHMVRALKKLRDEKVSTVKSNSEKQ